MEKVYDVVIIGSGPAGLTAAIYTTRGAASTLILGGGKWGGQLMLTTQVDNFPGFPDGIEGPVLMAAMRKQAEHLGAGFLEKEAVSVDLAKHPFKITTSDDVKFLANSLILTTGAQTLWLDIPGGNRLIGRGISSCAPCDAPFFKNKVVAVVGGGDSAMEEADVLTKYARKVILIHRRNEFRAAKVMQEKVLKNPKVEIIWNTEILAVKGEEKVERLTLRNKQTNKELEIQVDGLFVAIGHKPNSDIFKGQVELDEKGYIKVVKPHSKTSVEGVFVAGDVMDPYYKQAITSAGSGCAAALDTLQYLSENDDS